MEHNEYYDEIDLMQMILFCLKKWRSIIVLVVVGAVLGGMLAVARNIIEENDKEENPRITEKIDALEVEMAENHLKNVTEIIENTKLLDIDTYNMYKEVISIVITANEDNNAKVKSEMIAYINGSDVHKSVAEKIKEYNEKDLKQLISMGYEYVEGEITCSIVIYGANQVQCEEITETVKDILNNYLEDLAYSYDVTNYGIHSSTAVKVVNGGLANYQTSLKKELVDAEEALKEALKEAEDTGVKSVILKAIIGAILLAGVYGMGLIMLFLFGGKMYAVSNIEGALGTKVLGTVTTCEKGNTIDKMIFKWMNGKDSLLSKDAQEKIALINILNELGKTEKVQNVILVSTIPEETKESAEFIRKSLVAEGKKVSDVVTVSGNPDTLTGLSEYDAVIVLESKEKSAIKNVQGQMKILKDYGKTVVGIILV